MTAFRLSAFGLVVLALAVGTALPCLAQQEKDTLLDSPSAKLYAEAVFQYQFGDRQLAIRRFNEFMAQRPSPELAKALVVRYGERPLEAMENDPVLKGPAKRLRDMVAAHDKAAEQARRLEYAGQALQAAVVQFRIREFDRALAELTKLDGYNLTPAELFGLRREVGTTGIRFMAGGLYDQQLPEDLRKTVNEIARRATQVLVKGRQYADTLKRRPEYVDKLVDMLKTDEGAREVADDLVAAGEFAVPPIVHRLKTVTDRTVASRYEGALRAMGEAAVMPVVAAMASDDVELKIRLADVLGTVGDLRAVPALKAVVDDPKADAWLKTIAAGSLKKITGKPVEMTPAAGRAYFDLALRYYYDRSEVAPMDFDKTAPVWRWADGKLVSEMVPVELYCPVYAERLALDGMAVADPAVPLAELLVNAKVKQMVRRGITPGGDGSWGHEKVLAVGGLDLMGRALQRPVRDGDAELVLCILTVLDDMLDDDPESLARAARWEAMVGIFEMNDPLVTMVAANILAGNFGRTPFALAAATAAGLDRSLWQAAPTRRVLIVTPDDAQANLIRDLLRKEQTPWEVETFEGLPAAMLRSASYPMPDVVILDASLLKQRESALKPAGEGPAGARLPASRMDWFAMPVVVLAAGEDVPFLKRAEGPLWQGVMGTSPDAKIVSDTLGEALRDVTVNFRMGHTSEGLALRAATQLASLRDPRELPAARVLLPSVDQVVEKAPQATAMELAKFLSAMASPASLAPLRRIALDDKRNMEIRLQALRGIGGILSATRSNDPQVYSDLLGLVKSGDTRLAFEAASALGKGGYSPQRMIDLMTELGGK